MGLGAAAILARRSREGQLDEVAVEVPVASAGPAEEAGLVAAAQQGDLAAYEALVQQYEQPVYRVAFLVLRDAAEAEDAAQEAFVHAYRALGQFRVGEPLRPWLLRIVTNEAVSRQRAAGRRRALAARYERAALAFAEPSPEVVALGRERRGAVLAGLEQLGADDRLVLHLRYFLDLAEAEVAAALGCPRGTVKSRLHRALARLRPLLATAFPELVGSAGREEEIPA